MRHVGACRCGAIQIELDTDPFFVYRCHCSHCRAFATPPSTPTTSSNSNSNSNSNTTNTSSSSTTSAPYHAAAAVFRWNVRLVLLLQPPPPPPPHDAADPHTNDDDSGVTYVSTVDSTGLFAMARGQCRRCHDPLVEWCYRLELPFCMVAAQPFWASKSRTTSSGASTSSTKKEDEEEHRRRRQDEQQRKLTVWTADTNLFYDSGLSHRTPNGMRTTIGSDLASLLYEVWIIFVVAIPLLPRSIVTRLLRGRQGSLSSSTTTTKQD